MFKQRVSLAQAGLESLPFCLSLPDAEVMGLATMLINVIIVIIFALQFLFLKFCLKEKVFLSQALLGLHFLL